LREQIRKQWDLDFLSCDDFFDHVENTLRKIYSKQNIANLKQFNKSILDPTKMIFDAFTNEFDKKELINAESYRQVDKGVSNDIGYFHQNLFQYIEGWTVPDAGFDIENEELHIYAEMKNKHNTMNSSSSQKTYMKLQQKILEDSSATTYLVEVIAKKSQDISWRCSVDGKVYNHEKIRRISIDQFYNLVTGQENSFKKICEWLPIVILALNIEIAREDNTEKIISELEQIDRNFLDSIFKITYPTYLSFENLDIKMSEHIPEKFK